MATQDQQLEQEPDLGTLKLVGITARLSAFKFICPSYIWAQTGKLANTVRCPIYIYL